ncbi:MAG: tripartite tricarboxylate transporter substrate-binding protein, partial [Sulfuricaulis sp.]|nr:tripartite tricarboxylate transporter substrate-binding protein [Sulfuricaulis sp.]
SAAGVAKSGKARILAVTTATRSRTIPDIPTISESGLPGYNLLGWNGFIAPLGTPAAVVTKLNAVVRHALKQPDVLKQLGTVGQDPGSDFSPEQFGEFLKLETVKWTKLVNESEFKAN